MSSSSVIGIVVLVGVVVSVVLFVKHLASSIMMYGKAQEIYDIAMNFFNASHIEAKTPEEEARARKRVDAGIKILELMNKFHASFDNRTVKSIEETKTELLKLIEEAGK